MQTEITKLSNSNYDKIKFIVQILLPALGTLYFTLGAIWGLPNVEQVIGTTTALALFLGALIGISGKAYSSSDEKYDGDAVFSTDNTGVLTVQYQFNEYPEDLETKDELLLKVRSDD